MESANKCLILGRLEHMHGASIKRRWSPKERLYRIKQIEVFRRHSPARDVQTHRGISEYKICKELRKRHLYPRAKWR